MRASVNQLINKLNSSGAQEYVAKAVSQLTVDEIQAICAAMQANPTCAAHLVSATNSVFGSADNVKRNDRKAVEHVVFHLGSTLQLGIIVGFLLSTELGFVHVPGGVS